MVRIAPATLDVCPSAVPRRIRMHRDVLPAMCSSALILDGCESIDVHQEGDW
jgi:hypothetical protein